MIIFVLLMVFSLTFGSSWVREKGELFTAITGRYYTADKYFDEDGDKKPIGCTFKKRELELYGEYGLTPKTTLTFKLPYQELECGSSKTTGVADLELGFIRNLKSERGSLSLYGVAIIPTGYSIKDDLRLGYGRVGLEGGILYGRGFSWGFVDSGIGYRYYFGYPSSQVRAYILGGYDVLRELQIIFLLDAQIGLGDGDKKRVGKNITLEPDYKLIQIYAGPRLRFGTFSINVGFQRVIFGRKTGDGTGYYIGLWKSF
ncbi:hypothetical protein JCM9492_07660 [Aquifex pyrophilus]